MLWNNSNPEPTGDTVWSDEDKYKGKAATITIGSVEAVEQGQESITNTGSLSDAILNFKLPIGDTGEQGIQGLTGTITIGTVSTGSEGTNVIITNVGSPSQAVLDITIPRGSTGLTGSKGWSPVFAVITDGSRKVLKVSDWQGGEGTKPVVDVYMGTSGYTYVLADAVDIRGSQGLTGNIGAGVSAGGTANQVLYKIDGTDYNTGWKTLTKADVGLPNVDNTTDASKPVSTAQQTALNLKANLASPTFTGTVNGITKAMVGLGSVDNTADTNKPVSTAQQTALNAKQVTLVSGTNIKTVNNVSLLGSGNVPITSGLVSNLTCAVPLVNVNNQGNPAYYAMVQSTPNTLSGSVDGSGYWIVPATGVYDIYVEGRPDFRNEGGIYGVFTYVVHNHTTNTRLLENDCNFVINGTIGMWNKGVAMGVSLTAGQLIKFGQHMYMNSASGGYVAAHNVNIRFISR